MTNEAGDGQVLSTERQGDVLAIQQLAVAYGYAVDDKDWGRWEALFLPDAFIDYTHSGGITGTPSEMAAWLPGARGAFIWTLHSVMNHEIVFTGPDTATGRLNLFNRNAIEWDGVTEFSDVGGLYLDEYRRVGGAWRFSRRVERTFYVTGGEFSRLVRGLAAKTAPKERPPTG
jgi:hypothetical protein